MQHNGHYIACFTVATSTIEHNTEPEIARSFYLFRFGQKSTQLSVNGLILAGFFAFTGMIPAVAIFGYLLLAVYIHTLEYEQILSRAKVHEGVKWRRKSKKEKKEEIN